MGNEGSSAVLTLSQERPTKKKCFYQGALSCPSPHPAGLGGRAAWSRNTRLPHGGAFQPKNKTCLLFHSHSTRDHSPCLSLSHSHTHTHTWVHACSALTFYALSSSQASHAWRCLNLLLAGYCDLGIFFKRFFYYKPNGSCIQAPDKEAAYWVNSKQLASFWRLYNSAELFATALFLTCSRSAKTVSSEHKARLIPESSLWKVGCVLCEPLAARPCYICNTSFGLHSNRWLAHKTLTNLFTSLPSSK